MSSAIAHDPTEVRRQRGMEIAAVSRIVEDHGRYVVPSQTGKGRHFVTHDPESPHCSCPDFALRGQKCKHIFAVEFTIKREASVTVEGEGADRTVTVTETVTATKRITYRQQWPAYNAAQTQEKDRFQALLADLCSGLEEPDRDPENKGGRPSVPVAVRVFSAAFKVYSTVSCRRFSCDLKTAHEKGHIARLPHYNSVLRFLEDAELTPILHRLIVESSLPLKAVETHFAVDSSGFMTSRFERWFDQKYGGFKSAHEWVKVHLMTGVKTNVVTAVEIAGKWAGDVSQMPGLVDKTAENFAIKEVSADSAYAAEKNFEAVAKHGGTAFIAFKSGTTGGVGGLFAKMFHFYSYNRDEYLEHYHRRSNVESTFSMVKAKFGDALRSKSDTAMVNESLCKILCHNLVCLIQSAFELGIVAKFWGTDGATDRLSAAETDHESVEPWGWI